MNLKSLTVYSSSVSDEHRVDRVLGFFSSRPNWDTPPPHLFTRRRVCPFPVTNGGGGKVLLRTRGKTLWFSRYICTLWWWTHSPAVEGRSQLGRGDRHCGSPGMHFFGEGHTCLRLRGGGGGSQIGRGDRHCGTLGIHCMYFVVMRNETKLQYLTLFFKLGVTRRVHHRVAFLNKKSSLHCFGEFSNNFCCIS